MYGCGEQEAGVASGSGWNLWVWLLGVVVGRYIDFLILSYYSCICSFHFFKCFSFFILRFGIILKGAIGYIIIYVIGSEKMSPNKLKNNGLCVCLCLVSACLHLCVCTIHLLCSSLGRGEIGWLVCVCVCLRAFV